MDLNEDLSERDGSTSVNESHNGKKSDIKEQINNFHIAYSTWYNLRKNIGQDINIFRILIPAFDGDL